MNEIFGSTVIGSAQHTIAVGATPIVTHIRPLNLASPPVTGNLAKRFKKEVGGPKRQIAKIKEEAKNNRLETKRQILMDLDQNLQKRHEEKMEMEKRKMALLEQLISKKD